jgi:hypothetical protein
MAVDTVGISTQTIMPRNLAQYTAFRGVTDFSNIGQFSQFEGGYQFLAVLQTPEFINKAADAGYNGVKQLQDSFVHMLEYEFRGVDGLPDMTADTMEITDGNNTARLINNITWDTAATVSMSYFEKSGSLINKYLEYYLTGIKDRMSKAKTYHGLIKNGILMPGPENEIFTFLVYITDSTMMRLERAVLLCNAQPTTAPLSNILNGQKGTYENKEISIEFNCFPVMGEQVDKAAHYLLDNMNAVKTELNTQVPNLAFSDAQKGSLALDSTNYKYGIMDSSNVDYLASLNTAITNYQNRGKNNSDKEYLGSI